MESPGNISEEMVDDVSKFIFKLKNGIEPDSTDNIDQYAMQSIDLIYMIDDMLPSWPHSKKYLNQINSDFKECILDNLCDGLSKLGIPRTAFRDDQIWNFVASYNNRGDVISALELEIEANKKLIDVQSRILIEIANWPDHLSDIDQIRTIASTVLNPDKVNRLKILTRDGIKIND